MAKKSATDLAQDLEREQRTTEVSESRPMKTVRVRRRKGTTTTYNFVGEGKMLRKTIYVTPAEWSAILDAQEKAIEREQRNVSANDVIRQAIKNELRIK